MVDYSERSGTVRADLAAGNAGESTENDYLSEIEGVTGGSGRDYLYGSDRADVLYGNGGDDWIVGRRGDDNVAGGTGSDTIDVNDATGYDYVECGDGWDVIRFDSRDRSWDCEQRGY